MKKLSILLLVMAMVMALAACAVPETTTTTTIETATTTTTEEVAEAEETVAEEAVEVEVKDEYHFGYIAYYMADVWNQYSAEAFEYAATQADVTVKVTVLDANNDLESSIEAMETLIQQDVDGISIFPINPEQVTQLIKMANEAGIPVTVENVEPSDTTLDYISTTGCLYDNIGEAAMYYIAEQQPGAKVFFCAGAVGGGVYETYQEGVDRALEALDGAIEVVGTEHGDWETEKAMNVTQNFIQSGVEFDYIFANNDLMAVGAYNALKEAGMEYIPIVSTGGAPDAYDLLVQGVEAANMTAPVSVQGVQTFKNLYDVVVEGKTVEEKFQALPVIPVSSDALGDYVGWNDFESAYNYVYGG